MKERFPLNPSTGLEDAGLLPWSNGNPETGVEGSYPSHELMTHPQEELVNLIEAAGFTPSDLDLFQVARSVRNQRLNYAGAIGGTASAATLTLSPAISAYSEIGHMPLRLRYGAANTGAMTLNVNGLGAKALVYPDGLAMLAGEVYDGRVIEVFYDPTADRFVLAGTPIRRLAYNTGIQPYTSGSGNWTVPANVYAIHVEIVGGGGGGGFGSGTGSGSGGGGGGYDEGWFAVTPGQSIPYVVGAGGAGAASSATDGTTGGTTTWNGGALSATGGQGGQTPTLNNLGNSRAGGTGGSSRQLPGSVSGGGLPGLGGTGGQTAMKGSFQTNNATAAGNGGQGAGSGGGGGGSGAAGGNGANGKIVIRW